MTCPEERLVRYLGGEMAVEEERAFEQHLLSCETCWRAVRADRAAREALAVLDVAAPDGLEARVKAAVRSASGDASVRRSGSGPSPATSAAGMPPKARPLTAVTGGAVSSQRGKGPRRPHRRLLAAAGTGGLVAAGLALWLLAPGSPAEPPQLAAVVAMAGSSSVPGQALRTGEHMMVAHQPMTVRAYQIAGQEAFVATSRSPFPVPSAAQRSAQAPATAWTASKGALSMYGVNRPAGQTSMFVVAAMPASHLPEVVHQLHLD